MMGCGTDAFACCMDVFAVPRHCELCMTGPRNEQEERRFRLLVESVTDYAIFILDLQGRVTTWNAGAERIKGYTASEIIGQHFSKFYPREDVEEGKCERELEEASRAGRFEEEGWRIRKDGTRFWANVVITALRNRDGTGGGFAKVPRDLSERRAAEEEARRFRLLVESVKDYAIFMLGPRGHVATWNAGAERIKGYPPSEIIGQHFSKFYPREEVEAGKCERELDEASRVGRFEEEGWRVRKDGTRFWANVVITALRNQDGALVGFAKVTRDLTERKAAEEERVRLAEAREAERRNQEFLAIMGHEMRNPLAPMVTAVHRIRLRGGRDCDEEIAVLGRQLGHMKRLVDDLLDASRFLRDDLRLNRNVIEIGDVLANAVDVVASLLEEKRHKLVIDIPKSDLLVEVDAARMVQVFGNLLNNAAKYTNESGVIALSATASLDQVTVTIADSGIGIAADVLPRVFELFTQAEQGIDRRYGGLGIGLAVVKRLVANHGGDVTAESAGANRGSRFTVRLPRYVRTPAFDADPAPAKAQAALSDGPTHRILVVDDNCDGADMLRDCLADLGHEVRIAYDGLEALEIARGFLPALVFLDVGLPELSGYEVAQRMRRLPGWNRVPIVALTGYARDSDRALALESGFSSHMTKPIDVERLRTLVDDLIGDGAAKP
jgi:PAS domain S-box-containing protein